MAAVTARAVPARIVTAPRLFDIQNQKRELPLSTKLVGSSRPHEAVREIIAHPLTDRKESAMYKIHLFVQSPEVCLSVREVRIMHFVALKNDTPDNFEIAFAYLDTRDDIKHYGLFLSSEISEKEREKYLKLITDYANAKTIDGKRVMQDYWRSRIITLS